MSLVPSATEIVYLLGLGDFLAARSHDSNYPQEAVVKPVVSQSVLPAGLTSRQIDEAVRSSSHTGTSLFHVDQKKLSQLEPNLILTQELCQVCAPTFSQIQKAARILEGKVKVVSLEPHSIEDVFENIITVGEFAGRRKLAVSIIEKLKGEVADVSQKVRNMNKPSVVVIEWLDPVMIAAHWVPQMVDIAGGQTLLSQPFMKSKRVFWQEVLVANPDILILAPCGFDIERTKKEIELFTSKPAWQRLNAVKNKRVWFMDGDAYLTRSGPRLIDGIKIMAKIIHPEVFGTPSLQEAEIYA